MSSGNIAESLPCPEARNWSAEQWNTYYRRRRERVIALGTRERVAKKTYPQRGGIRLYVEPIGPIEPANRPKIYSEEAPDEFAGSVRRAWTVEELTQKNIRPDDLIPWSLIVGWICRKHQLTKVELFGRRRLQRIADARHELVGLARRHTLLSLADMGRRMNRDHTTALHSSNVFDRWVSSGRMIPWQAERMGER